MTRSHCSDALEQERQVHVVQDILRHKNFAQNQVNNMKRMRQFRPLHDKLYKGIVEHDSMSKIHRYLRDVFHILTWILKLSI